MQKPTKEFTAKLLRVRKLLKIRKLKGLLLSTRANFSWLTCGKTNQIRADVEKGVASLGFQKGLKLGIGIAVKTFALDVSYLPYSDLGAAFQTTLKAGF